MSNTIPVLIAALRLHPRETFSKMESAAFNRVDGKGVVFRFVGTSRFGGDVPYVELPFPEAIIGGNDVWALQREITRLWAVKYARRAYLEDVVGQQLCTDDDVAVGLRCTVSDYADPIRKKGETDGQYKKRKAKGPQRLPGTVAGLVRLDDGNIHCVDVDVAVPAADTGKVVDEALALRQRHFGVRRTFYRTVHHHDPGKPREVNLVVPETRLPNGTINGDTMIMEPRLLTLDCGDRYRVQLGAWLGGIHFPEPKR